MMTSSSTLLRRVNPLSGWFRETVRSECWRLVFMNETVLKEKPPSPSARSHSFDDEKARSRSCFWLYVITVDNIQKTSSCIYVSVVLKSNGSSREIAKYDATKNKLLILFCLWNYWTEGAGNGRLLRAIWQSGTQKAKVCSPKMVASDPIG